MNSNCIVNFIQRTTSWTCAFYFVTNIFFLIFYAGAGIGGKKKGALTQAKIKTLCQYYSKAIWANDNVEDMRKAVLASIHHCYSTDDHPQHQYCPDGDDSWCFYKRAMTKRDTNPYDHEKRVHNYLDYERLHKHLEPIYDRLTEDDLLSRCKLHMTQNANESFHNSMWNRCLKSKHHLSSLHCWRSATITDTWVHLSVLLLTGRVGGNYITSNVVTLILLLC